MGGRGSHQACRSPSPDPGAVQDPPGEAVAARGLGERPPHPGSGARKPRVGHRPAQVTQPRGILGARGGRLFPPPALLTSRRLRSAGCSRRERLSRYCHRGLSAGGSRRFSRRDRHGGHRLPAGERGAGSGLETPGRHGRASAAAGVRSHGLCSRARGRACGGCAGGGGCGRLGATHPGRGR